MGTLIEKTPWPAQGIRQDSIPDDYQWGYLYLYDDGQAMFDEAETPSLEEIVARWGHYFIE